MAWSYSGDPNTSDRDWIRWKIGDVDEENQEATNEEIDYALTAHDDDKILAAIAVIDAIIAKYSYVADHRYYGDYAEDSSQRVSQLQEVKRSLLEIAYLIAGGTSPLTSPVHETRFELGMHDTPGNDCS